MDKEDGYYASVYRGARLVADSGEEEEEDTVFQRGWTSDREEEEEQEETEEVLEPTLSFVTDGPAEDSRRIEARRGGGQEEKMEEMEEVEEVEDVEELFLHFSMDTVHRLEDSIYISSYGDQASYA